MGARVTEGGKNEAGGSHALHGVEAKETRLALEGVWKPGTREMEM